MASEVNLETILNQLEDKFESCSSRREFYQYIEEVFDSKGNINVIGMDRLMVIIEKDLLKRDTEIASALSALTCIVVKIKVRLAFIIVTFLGMLTVKCEYLLTTKNFIQSERSITYL